MLHLKTITRLQTRESLNLANLPDGIVAIFTGSLNSKLATSIVNQIEDNYDKFFGLKLSVFFATRDDVETDSNAVIYDPKGELASQCNILCKKNDQCEAILYFRKSGDFIEHLYTREKPEIKYNWITEVCGFAQNALDMNPDKNGLWKFGQTVTKAGEYLCVDCGYIETFKEGDVYPVCEVCLSGDPEGPTDGPNQGYWEFLA
ncbi:MAG: hypothetical protein H7196_02680 [candidate division SR1 bacterium]|nr:hypothetical protein [candidate division SR1 bacterium]